jgi:hypothetical protein
MTPADIERAEWPSLAFARRYGPAESITPKYAYRLLSLLEGSAAVTGEAYHELCAATVRELKCLPGWPSPLEWFTKTNVPWTWTLVSYHHRAQLCWEWSLWIALGKAARPHSWKPSKWFFVSHGQTHFGIPWLFRISLHRQRYGWMVSVDGENLIRFTAQAQGVSLRAKETANECS